VPIDFSDPVNRRSYSDREADATWAELVRSLVDPEGAVVVDVGCGGGTYTRAWSELGAVRVVGVDSSAPLLDSARADHGSLPGVEFRQGDAADTGLPSGEADVVFARALVHHVSDLAPVVAEARRLLRPGGTYLVQDRTPDDVALPGSAGHLRGWFFEVFPRLLEVESGRRRTVDALAQELVAGGLVDVATASLEEVRRRYAAREDYLDEIRTRTGRSILQELDDRELEHLVAELGSRLPEGPLVEQDRWTVWSARRPLG
jgi:ubiquinone/menaquinone biosynthesis C-methylase UbiE